MKNTLERKDRLKIRIGRDLRALRILWDIPQMDIAKLLKLDQAAVSKIENGRQSLSAEELLILRDWVKSHPNVFWGDV